jgi:hypothetical protein
MVVEDIGSQVLEDSGLTDSWGGFPKFRESDSRGRLVKEASLYDPTSFD